MGVSYTKLASIVAVAAVVGAVIFHQPVNAAPATFTWTGATGDHKMSTAGNWQEGSVPTAGSKLVFKCVDGPNENIQNDLAVVPSGLEVKKLDSLPANKSCAKYTINTMQFTPDAEFTGDQTSADNKDRRKIPFVSIDTVIGLSNMKWNGFNGEFKNKPTINRFEFANTGCNEIAESLRAAEKIVGENASVTPDGANSILVKNKGQLEIDEERNETSASKITFENGAMISHGVHCQPPASLSGSVKIRTTVLSGDIVLNGDVEYKLESMNDVKITGKLSGPGKFVAHRDNKGVVLVESSNNTSGTPNGRYGNVHGPKLIKLDGDEPDGYVLIKRGEAVLLNGIRHEVDILEGGVFSGNATLNYLLYVGGVISPGNNSPGKITTDSLNFGNSGVYKVKILNKDHYDQISVDLGVILDGGSLDLTYLEGGVIKKGDTFTIIDNKGTSPVTGTTTGTFNDLPEGAEITAGGVTFKISYVGGDGNDIVLTALNDSVAPKASKDPKAPKVPNTGGEKLAVNLIGAVAGVASAVALLIVAKRKSFNKK